MFFHVFSALFEVKKKMFPHSQVLSWQTEASAILVSYKSYPVQPVCAKYDMNEDKFALPSLKLT